jgi:hypothetical protein
VQCGHNRVAGGEEAATPDDESAFKEVTGSEVTATE